MCRYVCICMCLMCMYAPVSYVISCTNRDHVISSFPLNMTRFLSCLISLSYVISATLESKSTLALLLILQKIIFVTAEWNITWALHMLSLLGSSHCLLRSVCFDNANELTLVKYFAPVEMFIFFLSLVLLLWYVVFIGFCMMNHAYSPGIYDIDLDGWS